MSSVRKLAFAGDFQCQLHVRRKRVRAALATHGIKTAVVGPAPEPSTDVLTCLIRADFMNGDAPCSTMPAERSWQKNRILADLLPGTVQFIPIVPALCVQNCPLTSGEDVFYLDPIHLSRASRHILAPIFAKLISSSAMNLH